MQRLPSWSGAVLISLLLNLTLFGLMPFLIRQSPDKIESTGPLLPVSIIRMQQPEKKRPQKQMPTRQTLRRQTEKTAASNQQSMMQPSAARTLNIPFEINPDLPPLPDMPAALPMATVTQSHEGHFQGIKGVFEIGDIDGTLIPLAQTPPIYPLRAKRSGIEGWVKVNFIVNESGRVERITIVEARPENIFEKSVRRCVFSWRFKPGTIEGIPVKTRVETTIRFKLN